jgi:hypothetical protein
VRVKRLMREPQLFADRIFGGLPFVTLVGLLGVAVMALLGFERPDTPMFVAATLLLLAAPVGLALHLSTTKELTAAEKRLWAIGLLSWRGPALFGAYFVRRERRNATKALVDSAGNLGK